MGLGPLGWEVKVKLLYPAKATAISSTISVLCKCRGNDYRIYHSHSKPTKKHKVTVKYGCGAWMTPNKSTSKWVSLGLILDS